MHQLQLQPQNPPMRIAVLFSWLFLMPICLLSMISFCISAVSGQCLANQQSLLLQFKSSLVFDTASSTKLVHWNRSVVDCCSWKGVTCNKGRVIGLDLTNESISGGLNNSSSLFNLRYLQHLNLAYNNFSYEIPSQLDMLTNLSYLNLSHACFTGQIPIAISHLTRLVTLDLSTYYYYDGVSRLKLENPNLNILVQNLSELMELHLDHVNISANGYEWGTALSSSLPKLRVLSLSDCLLSGPLDFSLTNLQSLSNVSSYLLKTLDLSHNNFEGPIPMSIFEFQSLESLSLFGNNFNGSLQLNVIPTMKNLSNLDLSNNNLVMEYNGTSSSLSPFPQITTLSLASNKLKKFPHFLINLSTLEDLDLSDNQIHGEIPNWIWKLPSLDSLNLSYNSLETLDFSLLNMSFVRSLDLRSNQLQGQLSVFPKYAKYLDFSKNNFSSVIPASISDSRCAYFFSLSSNKLYGSIPESICNITMLVVLDLSNNSLSGTVPRCLIDKSGAQVESFTEVYVGPHLSRCNLGGFNRGLMVLNLRRNNLTGTISNTFPSNCDLQYLNLNGNQLEGKLPKSLSRCTSLQVLDIGNNHIKDGFPCYLKNISKLHVLILRSNKFYGPIDCPRPNASWSMLQIVDLASNNFVGKLPRKYFSSWMAMMENENKNLSLLNHFQSEDFRSEDFQSEDFQSEDFQSEDFQSEDMTSKVLMAAYTINRNNPVDINDLPIREIEIYYQDVITVISKGQQVELVKILTIFTSIDFSCNNFDGSIPEEVGELKSLYSLNLSHNAFRGQIPRSLGELTNLESLDLSSNKLKGEIPFQLADGLIFLAVLNLSFNQLVGKIPQIKQFATFSETSYKGNVGLCGPPLKEKCTREEPGSLPPISEETHGYAIDWNFLSAELGFVFGFGIVIGPLMFWKKWRICYYKHVDDIFFKMFPRLYVRKENRQRRAHKNQGQRAHGNQGRRH